MILKCVSGCELDSSASGQGPAMGSWKHGKEPSGSIQGEGLVDELNVYGLLEKDFAAWCSLVSWLVTKLVSLSLSAYEVSFSELTSFHSYIFVACMAMVWKSFREMRIQCGSCWE